MRATHIFCTSYGVDSHTDEVEYIYQVPRNEKELDQHCLPPMNQKRKLLTTISETEPSLELKVEKIICYMWMQGYVHKFQTAFSKVY